MKFWSAAVLITTLLLCGCDTAGDGRLSVQGSVRFSDGQPVIGDPATVVFVPDTNSASPPLKSASGSIAADGSFTLMTDQAGDGALPGDYRVILKVWSNYREQKLAVPKSYSEATTTPLQATVGRGSTQFEFVVEQ